MSNIMLPASPVISCDPAQDDRFGPIIQGCRTYGDLTLLFEQVVLTIAPAILFLLASAVRIAQLSRQNIKTRDHPLRYVKLVACTSLLVLHTTLFVLWVCRSDSAVRTAGWAAASLVVADAAICILSFHEHGRSITTSDFLLVYLPLSTLFDVAQVRTLWLHGQYGVLASVSATCVGLKFVILIFELMGKDFLLPDEYKSSGPESLSGLFNRRLFWWLNPLFLRGFRCTLGEQDIFQLDEALRSETLCNKLDPNAETSDALESETREKPSSFSSTRWLPKRHRLAWSTLWGLKSSFSMAIIPRVCLIALKFAQPFLINEILGYVGKESNATLRHGLVAATMLIYFSIAIATGYHQHKTYRFITMVRGVLVSRLYYATLTLETEGAADQAAVSLMSTDVDAITASFQMIHEVWAGPIEVTLGLWLLARQVGAICVATLGISIISVIAMSHLAKRTGPSQGWWNMATQDRVTFTSSVLRDIRGAKMLGLTSHLSAKIQALRQREMAFSKRLRLLTSLINMVASFPLLASPVVTFSIYLKMTETVMTDGKAFATLTLISLLSAALYSFAGAMPHIAAGFACFDRIQRYLETASFGSRESCMELSRSSYPQHVSCSTNTNSTNTTFSGQIPILELCQASVARSEDCPLQTIDIKVKPGQIIAVAGPVASGKSTLLRACIGEHQLKHGSISVAASSIGYCSQTPWLQNMSIRENILGQTEFDHGWYLTVVSSCALEKDFDSLACGDQTRVGSAGNTLSGGQRQRIALARAIYSKSRLLVLDDPFSSLDRSTAREVFSKLFGFNGLLRRNSIAVMVSAHTAEMLRLADWAIVLKDRGEIELQGCVEDLNLREESKSSQSDSKDQQKPHSQSTTVFDTSLLASQKPIGDVEDPRKRVGDVNLYCYYARSIGWTACLTFLVLSMIHVFTACFPQVWLRYVVNAQDMPHRLSVYLGVYGLFTILGLASVGVSIGQFFMHVVPTSAIAIHRTLASCTLSARLAFFDSTDSGSLLNRFSQDMNIVDTLLPAALFRFTNGQFRQNSPRRWTRLTTSAFLTCIASILLISIGAPYLAAAVPVICCVLYAVQMYYLSTSRQLRLLELEARSPLFAHFTETQQGLTTIRAFRWQSEFVRRAWDYIDASQRPSYLLYCLQRWLNVVMNLIVATIATILVAFALHLNKSTAGAVGVGLISLLGLNEQMALLVLGWTSLETSLGVISRVRDFERETPQEVSGTSVPASDVTGDWPHRGHLEFRNVSAGYSEGTQACLSDINVIVPAGKKLAIVGRTGSGKSSMVQAVSRMVEITSGEILVDGTSLSSLPLELLRSRLAAVPQEALLLPGTVRYNLDSRGSLTDEEISLALADVGLVLPDLEQDLESIHLSQGQGQLLALARALLRHSRLVVLDEATSSVDAETEGRIMRVIQRRMADCTVVAVVHRLDNLGLFDKVLVLDGGRMVHVGTPAEFVASEHAIV